MLVAGLVGWWLHDWVPVASWHRDQEFAHRAALAYAVFSPEIRHPVEVGPEAESHLISWLSKRLQAEIKVPPRTANGFDLIGGRLLAGAEGPAALFMYEDESGQRSTLYVTPGKGSVGGGGLRYIADHDVGVFYWEGRKLRYAVAGEMEKAELLVVSQYVHDRIEC